MARRLDPIMVRFAAAEPFDRWSAGRGFEYIHGFIGGYESEWTPRGFGVYPRRKRSPIARSSELFHQNDRKST
jgi:hypothetical protein